MKSDLDRLMAQRGIDAFVIIGYAAHNHTLNYMTNGAAISEGIVVKKRQSAPVLIVGPMEREEAARSGLQVETHNDYNRHNLVKEFGSFFEADLRMMKAIFERHGIQGTVGFYGLADPGQSYMMLKRLSELIPTITITGEPETTIFDEAYTTKDDRELEGIKSVAARTHQVMTETIEFIKRHSVKDNYLVKEDGSSLTVGDVKLVARTSILAHGLEEADGMIFALAHDAGVPHSRGNDADILELGKVIVFDLFPRDRGGGYFHDMTRTFCLGYAPPEVQRAYDQVILAFNQVMKELTVGEKAGHYQDLTCDIFEEMSHPTIRSNPSTLEGYVHSLGHGVGLQIHARPRLRSTFPDVLEPGQVFTVEPGLYYPEHNYGVRIEDTIYVDQDGHFHSLTPFPKDLIILVG